MDKSIEYHRKALLREALEMWEEKGELREIEKDPVVRLLFSALAYQSHTVSQEIASFRELAVNEFRNKMIPYHLIKPFPAYGVMQTKIQDNINTKAEPLMTLRMDENSIFEFGKTKTPFVPLFNTKIINATITDKQINQKDSSIDLTLSSKGIIENFAGTVFYVEGIDPVQDIEIEMNRQPLPLIKPDDYDNLPFTDWFQNHFTTAEENQLQLGCFDYWQELYLKQHVQLYIVGDYHTGKIPNRSLSPVFTVRFKNLLHPEALRYFTISINCFPVVNVQKYTTYLTDDEPLRKLSTDNSAFLNLLVDKNSDNNANDWFIRHFGLERYSPKELVYQLNDLFNRFVSDYYAFKDVEELKKGDKMENLYKMFKELLPVIKKDYDDIHPSVYAILKLNDRLARTGANIKINYLTTNGEAANGFKKGEKPVSASPFLNKEHTLLQTDTAGGRNEERNEENLNHLVRYNLLTKDRLVTSSDLKAFCYRELQNKIRNVSVKKSAEQINISIQLIDENQLEPKEITYYERLIQEKIRVRSLHCIPVGVKIIG
jgi:hypothetical protein